MIINMRLLVILLFFSLCCREIQAQVDEFSLNSSNPEVAWHLQPQDAVGASGNEISRPGFRFEETVDAVVPGIIFTSYVEAGLEKDPNFADNIYQVDETFYSRPFWYRTEFKLPKSYEKGRQVWLFFENTNRYADFYFNGTKLSGTENSTKDVSGHMLRTKYNVTSLINENGNNAVAVLITDADQTKTRDADERFGVTASPTFLSAAGWDWMPYVPGRLAGITGDVSVQVTGDVTMEDPWIRSQLESNEVAYLFVSSDLKNTSASTKEVTISGTIQPGNIEFSQNITMAPGATSKIYFDKRKFEELIVKNPKLWWPNGYGEPHLYSCKLTLRTDGEISDEREIFFGIREFDYRFVKNAAGWPVMQFYVNGQRIFIKGGNWGMSEYLLRTRDEEYETRIKLHKDMNYNMIRSWTGTITDEEFYEYCDQYGIMVWDDFWLYVAYNDVANDDDFKANALDKIKRLRNHASIALWCGANETHPKPELDNYLRAIVAEYDHNDRMYKSSSNQDGLSGSGWWGNQPPKHHFENSGSNLAWNNPPYPYGSDRGYGMRSEIGTTTFPNYESIKMFIPKDKLWPLPTDEALKEEDDNVWNKHFFGKEASNANPVAYKTAVNTQFGKSNNLEEFAEKAQYLNIEVMKGMYEAWNDKIWNDASGILIWMSQSAYPSFVWQTYDYYFDATGSYWGAKIACEPLHIQWNSSNNSVKAINTTSSNLEGAIAKATVYNLMGEEVPEYGKETKVNVSASNIAEAFQLNFNPGNLANGKKTVASSEMQPGEFLVDGGAGSRWESDYKDDEWIYVDLGKQEKIGKIILKWENAYAKSYELQISNDARKWKTVKTIVDGKGNTETLSFDTQRAQYVRMKGKKRATQFGYSIYEMEVYGESDKENALTPLHFIKLQLSDAEGNLISENFYWRNGIDELNYTGLNDLPEADVTIKLHSRNTREEFEKIEFLVKNNSKSVAFGNRLRFIDQKTGKRILPVYLSENYFTLMPGEERVIQLEVKRKFFTNDVGVLWKQYGFAEKIILTINKD